MRPERAALIVASYEYEDAGLKQLRAPAQDAAELSRVLSDPTIGAFDVQALLNKSTSDVNEKVEGFFDDRSPDDLLLLHFSCHGVKNDDGELYFAMPNTKLRRLGATAVSAEFVNRLMNRSRSRRIVLLLDCCYAGAFARGMQPRAGTEIDVKSQFSGRGRVVITASSAMQYAFEGQQLADSRPGAGPSVFTSAVVEGLRTGEADLDQDGQIGLDELYDYVFERVHEATPHQSPGKWAFDVQGGFYIARRSQPVSTPAPLPPGIESGLANPDAEFRLVAVQKLVELLNGRHVGHAIAARLALQALTEQDDSIRVRAEALKALGKKILVQHEDRSALHSAQLVLAESVIDFGRVVQGSTPPQRSVRFRSDGVGELRVHARTFVSWLHVRVREHDQVLVASIDTSIVGEREGIIQVESEGGGAGFVRVLVTVEANASRGSSSSTLTQTADVGLLPPVSRQRQDKPSTAVSGRTTTHQPVTPVSANGSAPGSGVALALFTGAVVVALIGFAAVLSLWHP